MPPLFRGVLLVSVGVPSPFRDVPQFHQCFVFPLSVFWHSWFYSMPLRSTWNFLGISSSCLKIFMIPLDGFILVALYGTLYHTCYSYISVKVPARDLLGQYISDFYHVQKILRDQRSKNYEQMALEASRFGTHHSAKIKFMDYFSFFILVQMSDIMWKGHCLLFICNKI